MSILSFLKSYLITIIVFFAIDMVWLTLVARGFYKKYLGYIMSPEVNWPAAIAFYLIFIAGLLYFSILPAVEARSLARAIISGALFGLVTYATYDLTNYATLRDWPFIVVAVDLVWGVVISSAVSLSAYTIITSLEK